MEAAAGLAGLRALPGAGRAVAERRRAARSARSAGLWSSGYDRTFHTCFCDWRHCLITVIALLICLIPKPENDLFFELRIGTDILQLHHLPHFDTYSWTEHGRRWDVPEWLAHGAVCVWRTGCGGFFGTWL